MYPYFEQYKAERHYRGTFQDYLDEQFEAYVSRTMRNGIIPMTRDQWDARQQLAEAA